MSLLVLTITVLPVQSRKLLFIFFSFLSLFSNVITSLPVQQFLKNHFRNQTSDSCVPCSIAPPPSPLTYLLTYPLHPVGYKAIPTA